MNKLQTVALLICLAASLDAKAGGADFTKYLAFFSGHCTQVVFPGEDTHLGCGNSVVHREFRDGRVSFMFRFGQIVMFLGGTEVKRSSPDSYELELIQISTLSSDPARKRVAKIKGRCAIDGDLKALPTITCKGTLDGKAILFVFQSDASPDQQEF